MSRLTALIPDDQPTCSCMDRKVSVLILFAACLLAGCAASTPKPSYAPVPAYVYLNGAFKAPGVYTWTNGMTLRDGVVSAGGFVPRALHWIQLDHADGTKESIRLPEGAILENPALKPGDRITSFK